MGRENEKENIKICGTLGYSFLQIIAKSSLMRGYSQMILLQYQTKYRKKVTVGEALRLLIRAETLNGTIFDSKGKQNNESY
jgi:hypothetical protein